MRVKRGVKARRRRNKVLKATKGFRHGRSDIYNTAVEALHRAWQYSFRDRKVRKRNFRKLWIARINAAARAYDIS